MFSMFTTVTSAGMANECQSAMNRNMPSCGLTTSSLPFRQHMIGSYELTGKPGHERAVTSLELPVSAACSDLVTSTSRVSFILSRWPNRSLICIRLCSNVSGEAAIMQLLLPCERLISTPSLRSSSTHSPRRALDGSDSPERSLISLSIRDDVIFIYEYSQLFLMCFYCCDIKGLTTVCDLLSLLSR